MRIYAAARPDGGVEIIPVSPVRFLNPYAFDSTEEYLERQEALDARQEYKLPKMMFEVSRTSDMLTHFDGAVHTLDVIALGLPGHFPFACVEIQPGDIPVDRSHRDRWELVNGRIQIRP